jgi:hypothetical protein
VQNAQSGHRAQYRPRTSIGQPERWKDNNLKRKASGWLGVLQLNKSVVTDNRAKSSDIRTIRPQLTSGDPAA